MGIVSQEELNRNITDPRTTKLKSRIIKEDELNAPIRSTYEAPIQFVGDGDLGKSEYDYNLLPSQIKSRTINNIRASQQPGYEQAFRAIGGGLYKGVLGALKDVGYLLDFENNIGRLTGAEEVDSNWWSDIFENAQKSYDENHPIYRYNPSKVIDWSDPGFYWSALQGVVESAVGFGALGAGVGTTVGRGAKYLSSLAKLGAPVENAIATLGTAAITNYAEGKVMSLEMFRNVVDQRMQEVDKQLYDKAFQQAKNMNPLAEPSQLGDIANNIYNSPEYQSERQNAEKQIRSIAGDEANKFQARNMVFMLSDAIAIKGIFRGTGYTRNLLKDKTFKNTALMIAKQAPTEYVEEVGQGVMQREGEYQAMKEAGMDVSEISSDPVKRVWNFITDEQTQLEGLMGLFGGPVQHVLVQSPMNLVNRTSDAEYRDTQAKQVKENQQLLNGSIAKQASYEKAKQDAIVNGDVDSFKAIQNDQFKDLVYQNSIRGTLEDLENKIKDVAAMSPEEAQSNGYADTYKEDAEQRLQQLSELENNYLKILRKFNGPKDQLIHKKIYDIEFSRKNITETLSKLKEEKSNILSEIQKEVKTIEDRDLSDNQMKLQDLNMKIKSLGRQKAKLTATRNEALLLPDTKVNRARDNYYLKLRSLETARDNAAYNNYTEADLKKLAEEVNIAQEEYNRLSQYAGRKSKNKKTIEKVDKIYNKQLDNLDKSIQSLTKERDSVKNQLKENKEKIQGFNTDNYSAWEDAVNVQEKIDNYTLAKTMYDNQYDEIIKNKAKYIADLEEILKEDKIDSKQTDIDNAPTTEAKKQIIAEEDDPVVKEELQKRNEKNIQNEERINRVEQAKQQPVITNNDIKEEVKTDETIHKNTKQEIIDDDTIEDVKNEIDDTQDQVSNSNKDIESVDNTGVTYSETRTKLGYNLLAHLSRVYKRVINNGKVDKEEITNELNDSETIKVLNPNKYQAGTKVILEVDESPNTIINFETGQTWSDLNITDKNSTEYINTVPIVVKDENNNVIGYLHQDSWINEENISGNVDESKSNLRKIREQIIRDGKYETTIKSKSIGYLFRNKDGVISVKEAIKDPNVELAIGGLGQLFSGKDLNNLNITNKDRIKPGRTYMVVQVGSDSNSKIYTAIPVLNKRMNESKQSVEIINSIQNAIRIYYNKNTVGLNPDEQSVYEFLGGQGYNLSTLSGLKKYINQFVQVFDNEGENISTAATRKFRTPSTKTLLSIDGQQIQFLYGSGKKGFININVTNPEQFGTALAIIGQSVLTNMYINTDKQSIMNPNTPVKIITNKEGKLGTEDLFANYVDFVKDNTLTDILSHVVDKDENGEEIYTYTIQPKVEINFDEIIGIENTEEILNDKPRQETPVVENIEGYEEYEQGTMNLDFSVFGDEFPDIDYLPGLEDKEISNFKDKVAGIIIDGLDTSKQNALVDVMFKDALLEILKAQGKPVNIDRIFEDVFKEVTSNYNVYTKNITVSQNNLDKATKNNDETGINKYKQDVKRFQYATRLFETYLNNKERFFELAKNRLRAESIIQATDLDENGNLIDVDERDNFKIYDRSSYQEDRDSKASKEIKRFLAGVREYKQDGSVAKNILGREKFMGYEDVYKQLQVLTENIVPDYNTILAKLKDNNLQENFPFLKDVVAKLEDNSNPEIEYLRKELTVLLTNHYSNSELVTYGKDKNDKAFARVIKSNSNSVEQAITEAWNSLIHESPIINIDENNNEILDIELSNKLIAQQEEWAKNPPEKATEDVKNWMRTLGIILSDKTWRDLENGKFEYNKDKFNTWKELFSKGPFAILTSQYLKKNKGKTISDNLPSENSTVRNLARLEGKYSNYFHSNSQREGNKTVYSYGTNKHITDVVRDFHILEKSSDNEGNTVFTNKLITDKLEVVFNNKSSWLNDMVVKNEQGEIQYAKNGQVIVNTESSTWKNLTFFTSSLEALKQQGQSSRDNRELNKLSLGEIEYYKIVQLTSGKSDDTGNNQRIIGLLYPTTSDKTTVMGLNTKAVDIKFDFATSTITDETIDMLYNSLVLPEIERILHINELESKNKKINLDKNYVEGSKKFLFLSELNKPQYNLFNSDGTLNSNVQSELKPVIKEVIKNYIDQLVNEKLQVWKDAGIIAQDDSNILIDNNFYNKFTQVDNRTKGIATDMVIQYLVGNANIFQTFIGDPALFYKGNTDETWINIGKRLAADIAPGEQGDGTMNNTYKQVFVNDRIMQSKVYEQLKKILGDKADKYAYEKGNKNKKGITTTDAQEYTTLLEKLYVMNMHGKIKMKGLYDKVHTIITRELSKEKPNTNYIKQLESELSKEEFTYLKNLTLQPDKPVYVKNIIDTENKIERRLYIKSSSFALSPFLTTGTELDRLRIEMETKGIARLAYNSAVKVGNIAEPATIWNEDGSLVENLNLTEANILSIPRSGFRIQQEVPYDPLKEAINKVSQASKNLFINMYDVDGFIIDWFKKGKPVKGRELNKEYLKLYKQMFKIQQDELFKQLEYNPETNELNIDKLKDILEEEAIKRNYPLADLHAFDLDTELRLLAFSPSASKYEALLNSIVTNRIIKMKFPGKSYVLGSEAGFSLLSQEDIDFNNYDIVRTKDFNGKELLAADGSGRPDQVILSWDFKENIDKYIGKDGLIDTNKIPSKLLERFGMRIPNQGPNSQAKMQVVGFFRGNVGDLVIAPKEFVIRMGSDFDVDKLYVYKYSYYTDKKTGKIKESTITREKAEELYNKRVDEDVDNLLKGMLGEEELEEIFKSDKENFVNKLLKTSLWNKILDIHLAIHSNPDQRVQKQIHQPLDFWKLDTIAKNISESRTTKEGKLFTGLSDEYQKNKFVNASAGKALVGVFSNDSMFNALVQDKNIRLKGDTPDESYIVIFGNKVSFGDLSNIYTLSTQQKIKKALQGKEININEINPYDLVRDGLLKLEDIEYKSEIISGFQSGAVDNEKEQILDKINANSDTAGVIKVLMMLGFDEEIPYFTAQDILVDYVLELKKLRGLGDFVSDVEGKAYQNIINRNKYKVDTSKYSTDQLNEIMFNYSGKELTLSNMKGMIDGTFNDNYALRQRAILDKFLELKIKGGIISKAQSALNLDSQGLGKSFIDTTIRENEIFKEINKTIENFDLLINPDETIPAMALHFGLVNNTKLWSRFLPYNKTIFESVFSELERLYVKSDNTRSTRTSFREKMWNNFKKFVFSNPNLLIPEKYDEQGNRINEPITDPNYVDDERKRLFIHTTENKSLARRVYEAKRKFPDNMFLKNLEQEVRKDGLPSTVRFRAASKEQATEELMYEHLVDLLVNERTISDTDTTRTLFQDLVWGAYLNGGVQEARQYVKFIPAAYLHIVPFAKNIISWLDNIHNDSQFIITENEKVKILPSVIKQIIQNNPEGLPKVVINEFIKQGDKLLYNGSLLGVNNYSPKYLTMYDKTTPVGQKNFRLYERIGQAKDNKGTYYPEYIEISVLGTSGRDKISEYNYLRNGYSKSVFGKDNTKYATPTKDTEEKVVNTSNTKKKPNISDVQQNINKIWLSDTYKNKIKADKVVENVLNKISKNSTDGFNKKIASLLLSKLNNFDLSKLDIELKAGLKNDMGAPASGKVLLYPSGKMVLQISTDSSGNKSLTGLEHTFLHEFIHVITKKQLENPQTQLQKQIVKDLENLRKEAINAVLASDNYRDKYNEFIKGNKLIKNNNDYFFYALTNSKDFVALMLGNEYVQKLANKIMVKDKSIFERFIDNIIKLLNDLGLNITKGSVNEAALESIVKLISETNETQEFDITPSDIQEVANNQFGLFDNEGNIIETLLPDFVPSSREIMNQFKELNKDGTVKKLGISDNNYKIMLKRAQNINKGQPYYKATIGETMGENVSSKSKGFYRIYLSPREELSNIEYLADLVPEKYLDEMKKQCK